MSVLLTTVAAAVIVANTVCLSLLLLLKGEKKRKESGLDGSKKEGKGEKVVRVTRPCEEKGGKEYSEKKVEREEREKGLSGVQMKQSQTFEFMVDGMGMGMY